MSKQLDKMDRDVLGYLQEDARITNTELARRVNLSPPGLQKRVKRLEEGGVIERYVTVVNRPAVGYEMLCFVHVKLEKHDQQNIRSFREWARNAEEVQECHFVTGDYDYLLKVVVRDREHLEHLIIEDLTPVQGIGTIRTSLVLKEIKETTAVPLTEPQN